MSKEEKDPMIGKRFGHLKVVTVGKPGKSGKPRYWCRCDCGNRRLVFGGDLRNGKITTCGREKKGYPAFKTVNGFKCLETGEIFATASEAAEAVGIPGEYWRVTFAASDTPTIQTAGFHPETGEPLHWCRANAIKAIPYKYGDYLTKYVVNDQRFEMVLLNTNTLYKGIEKTAQMFHTTRKTLKECLDGKREWAGKDEDGNRLYWMYYDEWKRLYKAVPKE